MPANSNAKFVKPWSDMVSSESGGEIKVNISIHAARGSRRIGRQLEMVVDIIWTVAGYTPGRFPHLEALNYLLCQLQLKLHHKPYRVCRNRCRF